MSQPPGYSDGTNRVWGLRSALYGLKQAAHAWHQALGVLLGELGSSPSQLEPAVFIRHSNEGVVLLHTHVHDCAGIGPPTAVKFDLATLLQHFEGREFGEFHGQVFLSLHHERN